ncbi:type IIS restriction enzyme [Helicobacter cinaedi]|nr:type IIS restriction enzyme [Helicobacter cinaedi]
MLQFVESFIKALQKECIKSVVLWQEKEREACKNVVKCDYKTNKAK